MPVGKPGSSLTGLPAKSPENRRAVWAAKGRNARRDYNLKWNYGVDSELIDLVWEEQGKVCRPCKDPGARPHRMGTEFVVDHDHVNGRFRGLLCATCNVAIGGGRDSVKWAINLANYINLT